MYICSSCGYKSPETTGLIQGKRRGCSSCGNSGWKCPKCGIYMKYRKTRTTTAQRNVDVPKAVKTIQKSGPISTTGHYERATIAGNRPINVKRK